MSCLRSELAPGNFSDNDYYFGAKQTVALRPEQFSGLPGIFQVSALTDERKNCEFGAKCDKLGTFECKDALESTPYTPARGFSCV